MTQSYTYFSIPFENVPDDPQYAVWFASWSKQRPTLEPGMNAPFVVGATAGPLPAGATLIANIVKDPIPPCLPPAPVEASMKEYQKSVKEWIALGRDP